MSKSKAGPVNPLELLSFVERVETVDAEVDARRPDRKAIFDEAKDKGLNTKLMRKLIAERKRARKANAAEEAALDEYRDALVTAVSLAKNGLSLRKAAKAAGVSKSSVQRALAVPASSPSVQVVTPPEVAALPPHDLETGEIPPGEGAVEAAKPVMAQATAPRGICIVCGRTAVQRGQTCLVKDCPEPTKSTDTPSERAIPEGMEVRGDLNSVIQTSPEEAPEGSCHLATPRFGIGSTGDQQSPLESAEDAANIGILGDQQSCGGGPEQGAARSSGTASGSLLQPAPQDPSDRPPAFSPAAREMMQSMAVARSRVENVAVIDPKPMPQDPNADGMDIPAFLRRERETAV